MLLGKQALEVDFLTRETAPGAVVQKLSGIKDSKQQWLCKRRAVYSAAAPAVSLCPTAAANVPPLVLKIQANWGHNILTGLGKDIPHFSIERPNHDSLSLGTDEL